MCKLLPSLLALTKMLLETHEKPTQMLRLHVCWACEQLRCTVCVLCIGYYSACMGILAISYLLTQYDSVKGVMRYVAVCDSYYTMIRINAISNVSYIFNLQAHLEALHQVLQ